MFLVLEVVLGGAVLSATLKGILDGFGSISRKVAMVVLNNSGYDWKSIRAFIKHGSTTLTFPDIIVKGGKINVYN